MATILMHPTLSVRGRVFLQRASLAGRLAAGASPSDSPELARRAEQLRSPRNRRILATSLERVIDAAEEPPRLIGLAAELRDTGTQVNVRGVALVDNLLPVGGSPLYTESPDETLEGAIRHARAALLLA